MRFDPNIYPEDAEPTIDWLINKIGRKLSVRVRQLGLEIKKHPWSEAHITETFSVEAQLGEILKYRSTTGRLPRHSKLASAYAFAAMLKRTCEELSDVASEKLLKDVRGALNGYPGLLPIAFELETSAHLMRRGFEVEWADLNRQAQFDFLAEKNGEAIEVECKVITPDAGRKIHRKDLMNLVNAVMKQMKLPVENGLCQVLKLTIPDRLERDNAVNEKIVASMFSALENKGDICDPLVNIQYSEVETAKYDFGGSQEGTQASLRQLFGERGYHIFVHGKNSSNNAMAFGIGSAKPDSVVDAVIEPVKKAADDQLSKTRPAIIAVQLVDLKEDDIQVLFKNAPNGLDAVAGSIFKDDRRAHVAAISFSKLPELKNMADGAPEFSASVITKFNDHAPANLLIRELTSPLPLHL